MDEDTGEDVRPRLHCVGERREEVSGLRLPHRDDPLWPEAAESDWVRCLQRLSDLGEDVEGVLIAWMVQTSIPCRFGLDEASGHRGGLTEDGLTAVDGECLGGNRHIGVAVAHQHWVEVVPVGCGLAVGDIHPFDHDRAVELGGIRGAPDEDPGRIAGPCGRRDRPPAVARCGLRTEGSGRARCEELLLHVAAGGECGGHDGNGLDDVARVGGSAERGGALKGHRLRATCRRGRRRTRTPSAHEKDRDNEPNRNPCRSPPVHR